MNDKMPSRFESGDPDFFGIGVSELQCLESLSASVLNRLAADTIRAGQRQLNQVDGTTVDNATRATALFAKASAIAAMATMRQTEAVTVYIDEYLRRGPLSRLRSHR